MTKGQSIIIIGGGAAGLMAARELSVNNRVTVLEAGDRLGGRIYTIRGHGFTRPVEGGAEFIHGNLPLTMQLLKEAGIGFEKTGGRMYSFSNGKWNEREEDIEGWERLMKKMSTLKEDTTLQNFLEQHFSDEKFSKLRQWARRFTEGFDAADPAKVSVFFLRDEWMQEDHQQYRITGGYGQLVNYLENECKKNSCEIYINSNVTQIEWVNGNASIYTEDKRKFIAEKVIITVPVSILQKKILSITPEINEYIDAAGDIGYGGVIKVVLEFKTAFWNEYKHGVGFIISDEFMPTWWTQSPDDTPLLTGWLGGPRSTALCNEDDETILQKSLQSLRSIFGMKINELKAELIAGKVFNWPAHKHILGAYSYETPLSNKAIKLLNTPIEDTLFFAGEALYTGPHPGTVEAAFVSGIETANRIKSLG